MEDDAGEPRGRRLRRLQRTGMRRCGTGVVPDLRPGVRHGSAGPGRRVTDDPGYLWGAGMTVRRIAWQHLLGNGFMPPLVDRRGTANYNSGGDAEICFALRLSGWRLWFEPALRLRHFLLKHRLDWRYLRRLLRGFGASTLVLDPYQRALGEAAAARLPASWSAGAPRSWLGFGRHRRLLWEMSRRPREGDARRPAPRTRPRPPGRTAPPPAGPLRPQLRRDRERSLAAALTRGGQLSDRPTRGTKRPTREAYAR